MNESTYFYDFGTVNYIKATNEMVMVLLYNFTFARGRYKTEYFLCIL